MRYPRDMHGYGEDRPDPRWPGGAAIAVQFVLNYEEGAENCLLHGDAASEAFLSDIPGAVPWPGRRHANMESLYEYGARAGFWRLHAILTEKRVPVTVFGVAEALRRSPAQVGAMLRAGWEIASHGLKWIDYGAFDREAERAQMDEAVRLHALVTGAAPAGWYTGRSSAETLDIATEAGSFRYLSDSYADDLPYWRRHAGRDQLVVPYALDTNDMRFATTAGFGNGEAFESYVMDAFDRLHAEGLAGRPAMLSVGLHCRLVGRPGRAAALARLIDRMASRERVWFARRIDIADHWHRAHPAPAPSPEGAPSRMDRDAFVARFGDLFEHSPWIAERAHDGELGPANDTAGGLHAALVQAFRAASEEERLSVLRAHPDLAGKLAAARLLTESSAREQAGAGLDAMSAAERGRFAALNERYAARFGFPFIVAVKGRSRNDILAAFEARLANGPGEEFATACREVERIALLRLAALLPA